MATNAMIGSKEKRRSNEVIETKKTLVMNAKNDFHHEWNKKFLLHNVVVLALLIVGLYYSATIVSKQGKQVPARLKEDKRQRKALKRKAHGCHEAISYRRLYFKPYDIVSTIAG